MSRHVIDLRRTVLQVLGVEGCAQSCVCAQGCAVLKSVTCLRHEATEVVGKLEAANT